MMNGAIRSEVWKYRCRMVKGLCRLLCIFISALAVMCSSCSKKISHTYRLSRGGYSPNSGTLLVKVHVDLGEPLKEIVLFAYREEEGSAEYIFPTFPGPFDFAWAPKQDLFLVTHGGRLSLFQKSEPQRGYTGTAIRCPIDVMYTYCAWNADADWLAVNCYALDKASDSRRFLGLYSAVQEKLMVTSIPIDNRRAVWKDNTSLYVPQNDSVVEVRIDSGKTYSY